MLQDFNDTGGPARSAERVAALRAVLARRGLAGYLVPRADEHLGEYVPACAERLRWLTGFSGSAGLAVVLLDTAALFVDGRYRLQARKQADERLFDILQTPENKPSDWLKSHLQSGAVVGFDPRLHSMREIAQLEQDLSGCGIRLAAQDENLIDALWHGRPPPPAGPVMPHALKFAGMAARDKIADLQRRLREAGADASVLTAPDSIAWLFNIRGRDVAHTPVALAFAIVPAEGRPELFIARAKLRARTRGHLERVAKIYEPQALDERLRALGARGAAVRLDPNSTARWFADRLGEAGARIVEGSDPCLLPKAIKNATEIAGARAAHLRDGTALCRFLAWLDAEAGKGDIDEITAAQRLEALRAETGMLKDLSFDTISAAGPNGAIVHYRVTRASNRPLKPGTLYLVDSGAQYEDGTTDVTRTVAIGKPTPAMRRNFTLVLKGHIAIATARFPKGTRGQDLDPFARRWLWQAGLDYDHGTGHGVGSYLSVHEGPQRLSRLGSVALEPGMILSNEPGYYRDGAYGIRIENLVLVTPPARVAGGEREMMGFETLTLAPIDLRLVEPTLMTAEEIAWLDRYHARVFRQIAPQLSRRERTWLRQATRGMTWTR